MYLKHIYIAIGILILFFSIQVMVISAGPKGQTDNILNNAEKLIEKKDYKNAENSVKKVIQTDPSSSRAYYLLGKIYQEGYKKYSNAIGQYKKAIKLNPSYSEAHYNVGSCYYALGKKESAIIWIDFSKQLLFEQKKYDKYQKTLQILIKIVEDKELKKMYENELYRYKTYGVEPTVTPFPIITPTEEPIVAPTIAVNTPKPTSTPKPTPTIIQINIIPTQTPTPVAEPTSSIIYSNTPWPAGELPEDVNTYGSVYKGVFYGADNYKQIYAINNKGEKLWAYKGEDEFTSYPCIKDNSLYINCANGDVYSINIENGKVKWKFSGGENIESSSLIIDDKLIYIVKDNYLYGLNKEKGNPEWKIQLEGESGTDKLLTGGVIYLGTKENKIYAINISGKLLWKYVTSGETLSPLLCSSTAFYGANLDGTVYGLTKKEGREIWKFKTENEIVCGPLTFNDNIYICDKNGNIYCISQNIGESVWTYNGNENFDEMKPFITSEGIMYGGTSDCNVIAINAKTGELMWKFKCGGELKDTEFSQIKDIIIFMANDNKLYGINYKSGNLVWTFSPPTGELVNKKPVIFGSNIYIVTSNGTFYVISSDTGKILLSHITYSP